MRLQPDRQLPLLFLLAGMIVLVMAWSMPAAANASQLVARNANNPTIKVNKQRVALVEYKKNGKQKHELWWGAKNVYPLKFHYDRSGGWKSKKANWKKFRNVCGKYTGPDLAYVVAACTHPDGSHYVLQQWVRVVDQRPELAGPTELRLSHFTKLADLRIWTDWYRDGQYPHMWGQLLWNEKPWAVGEWREDGYVLDGRGRNVQVDSLDSDAGAGWKRINGFLAHAPSGQFCYGFGPKPGIDFTGASPSGWYRATVPGPGVSPDIMHYFRGQQTAYDPEIDAVHNYWQGVLTNWADKGSCSLRN